MSKSKAIPAVLVAFAFGWIAAMLVALPTARAGTARGWEYRCFVVSGNPDEVAAAWNAVGKEGWEYAGGRGANDHVSCFKRGL